MKKLISCGVNIIISLLAINSYAQEGEVKKVEPGIIVEKGGSMVGNKTFEIEPGFQYTHNSSNQIDLTGITLPGLVIGLIQIEKIQRDIFIPSLTFRLGLSDFFQMNLDLPYVFRNDEYTYTPAAQAFPSVTVQECDQDIGDISGGFLFHLLDEKGSRPQLIGGLKIKSRTGRSPYNLKTRVVTPGKQVLEELPTGTGHWAVEPSLTVLKTTDPAVLFANFSYFYHIERDVEIGGVTSEVDPSDSYNFSLGMGFALNDRLALSTSYEHKVYTRMKIDGQAFDDTDPVVATLQLGTTYATSDSFLLNFTLGIGLTEDSPDVTFKITTPIRYIF